MYTYQMIGVADENGKTYKSKYGTYSKENGFVFTEDVDVDAYLIDRLFHDDLWRLEEPVRKKMSLADIEKELGYRVQIVDPEYSKPVEEKDALSDKRKEEVDDAIDFFKRLFGIEIDPKRYY